MIEVLPHKINIRPNPIAESESKVFYALEKETGRELVVKIYDKPVYVGKEKPEGQRLTYADLLRYQKETQEVSAILNGKQVTFPFMPQKTYSIITIPIEEVGVIPDIYQTPFVVMPFIPGPHIDQQWSGISEDVYWGIERILGYLSRRVQRKTGKLTCNLSTINIKRDDVNRKLFITDIASSLRCITN